MEGCGCDGGLSENGLLDLPRLLNDVVMAAGQLVLV
jgi:hypothetical protein